MTDILTERNSQRVSVIVPMYNGSEFVKEALESILQQTYPIFEVIVVNDGSDDNGPDIIRGYKNVTLINKAHTGLNDTINHGLQYATGNFIAFLDADDRWLPFKIAKQIDILLSDTELGMTFGYAERFQSIRTDDGYIENVMDILPGIVVQGGLFTKNAFDIVGEFTDDPNKHGFIDWYARASELGIKMNIEEFIVFQRRIHENNEGVKNKEHQRKGYFNTLKAALDRRRENLK